MWKSSTNRQQMVENEVGKCKASKFVCRHMRISATRCTRRAQSVNPLTDRSALAHMRGICFLFRKKRRGMFFITAPCSNAILKVNFC